MVCSYSSRAQVMFAEVQRQQLGQLPPEARRDSNKIIIYETGYNGVLLAIKRLNKTFVCCYCIPDIYIFTRIL